MRTDPTATGTPSAARIRALAAAEGIPVAAGEWAAVEAGVAAVFEATAAAQQLVESPPAVRRPHRRPTADEDPFNAWITCCDVGGHTDGPLTGLRVGIKDNIALAGVPTTNGSPVPPFVPVADAVVVERLLAAGARIVGKTNMDSFGAGGTGELSAFGPTRNPHDPTRSAGGSSSGSGAAVAAGEVDLALGVDQGGSGRIPAAACGVVGLKASQGVIPTHGVTHIDHTIDHVTPIGRSVEIVARAFAVLAGRDERDPQWIPVEPVKGASGPRTGRLAVIEESVPPTCAESVRDAFEASLERLRADGRRIEWISVPAWRDAGVAFNPYVAHAVASTIRSEGAGYGHLGELDGAEMAHFARWRRREAAALPPQTKAWLLAERELHERTGNRSFATLQTLRRRIRREISAALAGFDALLTPTLLGTAPPLLADPTPTDLLARCAATLTANVAPLNLTGHPALTLPNGSDADGLPIGLQLVGPHGCDLDLLALGTEIEMLL